jgi:hypothetical protein
MTVTKFKTDPCHIGPYGSDMLEGVEIIKMGVLTDRGVVGGVGGGEYDGRGVSGWDNEEDILE